MTKYLTDINYREQLTEIHKVRMRLHWGSKFDALAQTRWPKTDEDWRQTPHGAPWDANVFVAEHTLKLARELQRLGLLA